MGQMSWGLNSCRDETLVLSLKPKWQYKEDVLYELKDREPAQIVQQVIRHITRTRYWPIRRTPEHRRRLVTNIGGQKFRSQILGR